MTRPPLGLLATAVCAALAGCKGGTLDTRAADQAAACKVEVKAAEAIAVPDGFRAVQVVEGLNFPSSITWDEAGRLYVLESHSVAVPTLKPKILRVAANGELEVVELEGAAVPTGETAVGITFRDGWLYLSHEEKDGTWGISRVRPAGGAVEAVLRGMPGDGDHWLNYLVFDRSGNLLRSGERYEFRRRLLAGPGQPEVAGEASQRRRPDRPDVHG